MKPDKNSILTLQALETLGHLIVWQTRVIAACHGEENKKTVVDGLAVMTNHTKFLNKLFEASMTKDE